MAAKVRGVLFDYGLVLSGPPRPEAWARLKGLLAASEDSMHTAYWAFRHEYDRGALNGTTYWESVAHELGRSDALPTQLSALQKADADMWTAPNAEMIAWAAALQQAGIRIAILSNLGDDMERGVRERCAWIERFDHHTFSHALGTAKPDPAIYRHAAEGMNLLPEEILFIDDREENVAAALAEGMQAVQYVDHKTFLQLMHKQELDGLLQRGALTTATNESAQP